MKNIFVYIGSPRGDRSNTVQFANEIFSPKNVHIGTCKGCLNCFFKGFCILDENDDMRFLKEKMLKADFIIFGSPVYVNYITSDMKIFIDRIAYWTHLMRLAGKPGIILSTASSDGDKFVSNYLYKIMSYLGIKAVGRFNAFVDSPQQLNDEEFIKNDISKYAEVVYHYTFGKKKIVTDNILETIYIAFRSTMKKQMLLNNNEYAYWEENNMFKYNSFKEFLEYKLNHIK